MVIGKISMRFGANVKDKTSLVNFTIILTLLLSEGNENEI